MADNWAVRKSYSALVENINDATKRAIKYVPASRLRNRRKKFGTSELYELRKMIDVQAPVIACGELTERMIIAERRDPDIQAQRYIRSLGGNSSATISL